jgi:hypothetical protein
MTTANTKASLDALYKDVYGDKLQNLKPDFGILMKDIKFREAKKTGRDFVEPVSLTHEHGFTYGAGLQTLSDVVLANNEEAKVRGNSLTLRTAFSYDAAANMVAGGKEAFIKGTEYKFRSMMEAATYRLEAQLLYGSSHLGAVASADDGADTITISDATWSPGIWAGAENAVVDIYQADGATVRLANVTVSGVDSASKTLSFSGTPDFSAVVAGDILRFKGATGNEMVGIRNIISNTGTLYSIDGSGYSLWQGNVSPVGAANLTLKKIYQGVNLAVGKGLMEDVIVLVSPATFATLANDEASLRRYSAVGKAENGFEAIEYYGPNGKIKVKVHPMVREGEAMAYPEKRAERIGATDITFKTPGRSDEMFQQLPTETGYECRLYSEQALWLPCPAKGILFTGISNA